MMALQMSSLGFAPVIPLIQKAFNMSYSQVGLFTGLYGILALILSVPAGLTAKRLGEKTVMVAGVAVVAIGLLVLSRATDFDKALTGRIVWITGYRFAFVCVLTALAVTCPPSLRGLWKLSVGRKNKDGESTAANRMKQPRRKPGFLGTVIDCLPDQHPLPRSIQTSSSTEWKAAAASVAVFIAR